MPTAGDTRLQISPLTGLNIQNPVPANGAIDVAFDLAQVYAIIRVDEYLTVPVPGWYSGAFTYVTSVGALSIAMSGGISMNTPTGEIGPGAYNNNIVGITSTSAETFAGETEYTWSFDSIILTHGTATFGSVTREYSTDEVSFTTGAVAPLLEYPTEDGTNYYLNKDWLLEMRWTDGAETDAADYTVYFNGVPQNDRSRYSIVTLKMWLGITLEYFTTYEWFVRKDLGGGAYIDSATWQFTTMDYTPPAYSTRERLVYGEDPGGDTVTVPSGENNIITVQRLIAVANNKFFYEDV